MHETVSLEQRQPSALQLPVSTQSTLIPQQQSQRSVPSPGTLDVGKQLAAQSSASSSSTMLLQAASVGTARPPGAAQNPALPPANSRRKRGRAPSLTRNQSPQWTLVMALARWEMKGIKEDTPPPPLLSKSGVSLSQSRTGPPQRAELFQGSLPQHETREKIDIRSFFPLCLSLLPFTLILSLLSHRDSNTKAGLPDYGNLFWSDTAFAETVRDEALTRLLLRKNTGPFFSPHLLLRNLSSPTAACKYAT